MVRSVLQNLHGDPSAGGPMGRRRFANNNDDDDNVLDAAFELFLVAPVWVGPIVAAVLLGLFRYVFPAIVPASDKISGGFFFHDFFPLAGWAVAGAMLFLWIVAEGIKRSRR